MNKQQKIILGFILAASVFFLCFTFSNEDYSKTFENKHYDFFGVPITSNLAQSLKDCKPYKRTYKPPFGDRLWQVHLGIGSYAVFSISGRQNNKCIVNVEHYYKTTSVKKLTLPVEATQYIGELLELTLNFPVNKLHDIEEFDTCADCFVRKSGYSVDDPQYLNDIFTCMERYTEAWAPEIPERHKMSLKPRKCWL